MTLFYFPLTGTLVNHRLCSRITVLFHLIVPILDHLKLHGHVRLNTGQWHLGGLPDHTQRAEVVKLPPLLVKSSQVQNWVVVV